MRKPSRLCARLLLPLLLGTWCSVCAGAAPAPAAVRPAQPPSAPDRETREWQILVQRGDAYLDTNSALVDSIARELPAQMRENRNRMIRLEVRFFRLLALYGARKKTPSFAYDIDEQVGAIDWRMRVTIEPLEKARKALIAVEEFVPVGPATTKMLGYKSAIDIPAPESVLSMLADFKRRNGQIRARAAALRAEISERLGEADKFLARAEKFRALAAEETGGVLRDYYVVPEGNLVSLEGVRQAWEGTCIWFRNFAAVDLTFNQFDNRIWGRVFLRFLFAIVILLATAQYILRRVGARAGGAGLGRVFFRPVALLSTGIALSVGVSLASFTRSAFIVMVIWIFLSLGLIVLGERLCAFCAPTPAPRIPWRVRPLWCAVAVGNVIQSLDFRTEALALLWAAALALLWGALLARRGEGDGVRRALYWLMPALLLLALIGWANLAVFAATIILVLYIGAELSGGIAAFQRRFPLDDAHGVRPMRIVRDVFSPINVFNAAILAALAGYAVYLGGGPVLRLLFALKLEWRKISLHVASIPLIVAGYFVTKTVVSIVGDIIQLIHGGSKGASEGEIISIQVLGRYLIWFLYLMCALSLLGFTMGNLALVAGGLSVGIGFGMQNIINNLVSGIILLLGREIQPGDMIERDGDFVRVEQVTLRNTILRTYAGKTIISPNSEFITKPFANWTYRDSRIRGNIVVKVPASVDSRQIEELLLGVAHVHPSVLKFPAPTVRLENFVQGNLEFELRVWVAHPRDWKVISDLRHEVCRALKERGITVV